jgi:hypothetical protein
VSEQLRVAFAIFVMPGFDPGIHLSKSRWIAGSSPAMTRQSVSVSASLESLQAHTQTKTRRENPPRSLFHHRMLRHPEVRAAFAANLEG